MREKVSSYNGRESLNSNNQNGGIKIHLTQLYRLIFRPVIEIANLRVGSPADSAGLKLGDIDTIVNGTKVGDIDLQEIMYLFQKKPGSKIKLGVLRNGIKHNYKFTLKTLLYGRLYRPFYF